jgi:hypothetical protein
VRTSEGNPSDILEMWLLSALTELLSPCVASQKCVGHVATVHEAFLTQEYSDVIIAPGTCFNPRHGLLKGANVKWGANDVHRTADKANIVSGCAGI